MTVNQLERIVTRLVNQGHGDKDLRLDDDPERDFDIEFIEYRERETDDGDTEKYVGVRTNS